MKKNRLAFVKTAKKKEILEEIVSELRVRAKMSWRGGCDAFGNALYAAADEIEGKYITGEWYA